MRVRRRLILSIIQLLFFLISAACLFPQSNRMIDEILEAEHISFYHTAYMLCYAADIVDSEDDFDFIAVLRDRSDFFLEMDGQHQLNTAEFSLALMVMFEIGGGIMYSIFNTPHYAYREMTSKGIIEKDQPASKSMTGEKMLVTIQRALEWKNVFIP